MKAIVSASGRGFAWTVEHPVGRGCANTSMADIFLVQWGLQLLAARSPSLPAATKLQLAALKLTGRCSGLESDPLIVALRSLETAFGNTNDGKVSVLDHRVHYALRSELHAFVMGLLTAAMFETGPKVFPRLDAIPGCPPMVAAEVVEIMSGLRLG